MKARWLVTICWLQACTYDPQFIDGRTRCGVGDTCPTGFTCDPARAACVIERRLGLDAGNDNRAAAPPLDDARQDAPGEDRPADADRADLPVAPDLRAAPEIGAAEVPAPDVSPAPETGALEADARDSAPAIDRAPGCDGPSLCRGQVGTACDGTALVRCELDLSGCLTVRMVEPCSPPAKPCQGSPPTAACACVAEPPACQGLTETDLLRGPRYCHDGKLATCEKDALGCMKSSESECPVGTRCREVQPWIAECGAP